MTAALDPAVAARLAKVLGLLGSAHDGERASAAAMADRIVRAAGLTWHDIIIPNEATAPPPEPEPARHCRADILALLRDHADQLTEWELGFLQSLARRRGRFSPRQHIILAEIWDRVEGTAK